jgi:hypothetical protein
MYEAKCMLNSLKIMVAFCHGIITDDNFICDDIIQKVYQEVMDIMKVKYKKLGDLHQDISMLRRDEHVVACDEKDYRFSFLEYIHNQRWDGYITIDEFIDDIDSKRALSPLHTPSNLLFKRREDDIDVRVKYLGYTEHEAKQDILEQYGRTTSIDIINLIRKVLDGELSCNEYDSDPCWDSCCLSLYNVDTRYFIINRGDGSGSRFSAPESFKSQLSFHINGAAAHFTPYNYGFSWVPSASEDEYGRLFIKADNEMGDRYWEGDLPHYLDYIVD